MYVRGGCGLGGVRKGCWKDVTLKLRPEGGTFLGKVEEVGERSPGAQQGTCKDPEAGGWHWEKLPAAGPLWPGVERGSHSTSRGRRAEQGTSRELGRLQKRFKLGRAYSDGSFLCFFLLY